MRWADEVSIETPEQIELQLEVAGLGSRFVAQVLDWVIKWGVLAGVLLLVVVIYGLLGQGMGGAAAIALQTLVVVLFYSFLLGFDIYYEVRHNGQTPGKKLAGVRVVRDGGGPVDFRAAAIRNLLGMADFLPFFYLLGALLILLNRRGQRLGDMAAGTLVVRERALAPPEAAAAWVERFASSDFAFTAGQLAGCTPADRQVIRSYFERRDQMDPDARDQLAFRLAEMFCQKTGYEPPRPIEDAATAETFLACLYRDVENWARHGR